MFDVIDSWNKANSTVRNEKTLRGFKKTLLAKQKSYLPCSKIICYICVKTITLLFSYPPDFPPFSYPTPSSISF